MRKRITNKNCTICGNEYHNISFMGGSICEDCVGYITSEEV